MGVIGMDMMGRGRMRMIDGFTLVMNDFRFFSSVVGIGN